MIVLPYGAPADDAGPDAVPFGFDAGAAAPDLLERKRLILAHATAAQKGKLEQLSWLGKNDAGLQKEAFRQYNALWKEIETDWIAEGCPK